MPTKVTIKFSDDNGDPAGGSSPSDNDGYRIYRAANTDPGTEAVNLLYEETNPTQGTGEVTYVDTTLPVNLPHYYRLENVRGTETAVSPLVGPIVISDLDKLGYPESKPSNTDGVTNFINVEPLVHLDSAAEVKKYGIDYRYKTGEGPSNLSKRYSGMDQVGNNWGLHFSRDGSTPEIRCHNDLTIGGCSPMYTKNYNLFCSQLKETRGLDPETESRLVLDNGACLFYIFPSYTSHPGATSSKVLSSASQHLSNSIFSATLGARVQPNWSGDLIKNHKSRNFSDGGIYSDPEPWQNTPNPKDPGWYPKYAGGRTNMTLNFGTFFRSNGMVTRFHHGQGGFYSLAGDGYELGWGPFPDLNNLSGKINVFCRRVYPNGAYDIFINGVKSATSVGNHKSLIQIYRTPSGHDSLSNTWWTQNNLLQDLTGNGLAEDMHMITPPALGLNATSNSGTLSNSMYRVSSLSAVVDTDHSFNEAILIPDDLTANSDADFNRMIAYINTKYGASTQFATQGDYS